MQFVIVVQLLSCVQLFLTPWTAAHQTSLSFTVSWTLLKFTTIELVICLGHSVPPQFLVLCPFSDMRKQSRLSDFTLNG